MNEDAVDLDLTEAERDFMVTGLAEWGGPATMTDALAGAVGFGTAEAFSSAKKRLMTAMLEGHALSEHDWRRALAAAEISFASNIVGVGLEWEDFSLHSDERTLEAMRSVQRKLALNTGHA